MSAQKFTRNKDYSDEANNNAGGRDTVDCAGLDGEMDEIVATTDDHADKLDILLRDDLLMQDDILKGHEFAASALTALGALLGLSNFLNWKGNWVTATDYVVGDLVYEASSLSSYVCLVDHTSGTFSTDLSAAKWNLFASGSTGLPSLVNNRVLSNNGAALDWRQVTTTEAPTLAPLANPIFSGLVTGVNMYFTGAWRAFSVNLAFSAGSQVLDFSTAFMKRINVSADYTSPITAASLDTGRAQEIHFTNTKGSDAVLLWNASWRWMGYIPSVLPSGKKAVLTLRVPTTGGTNADVVAMWSVEP